MRANRFSSQSVRALAILLVAFLCAPQFILAASGVPKILNYQGRLMDSSGVLLGGSGTQYCFQFSFFDNATVGAGAKLWPSSGTSTMTVMVKNGIFNVGIGDTNTGGDALDFNFQDTDSVYLNVDVATKVGATCAPGDGAETYETLGPRPRIYSSGFAVNASAVGGFSAAQLLAQSFSTTSADYFTMQRNFFSTTSSDWWKTRNNFFSTSSADYYLSQNQGSAFSTTSASYFVSTYDKGYFFSTTSADYWKTANNFFSTTSADYWKSAANFFSTTSADWWKTQNNFFSTSSADYLASQRNYFSTTSADFYADASTTIAKTYTNNSFGGMQTFVNASIASLISTSASTTNISASYASSTQGFFGALSVGNLTGILKAVAGAVTNALVDLASDVTGVLPVANGGTGWASLATGAVLYGNGTGTVATTSAGLPGQILALLNGVPAWTATTTFSGALVYSNGNVTLDTSGNWSGTLANYTAAQLIALGFSTTSADFWTSQRNFFATSSADYWKSQNNFFSTTSADAFIGQRNFFSTTSADYYGSVNNFFSTTSSDYWQTQRNFFSTTSAGWFLSQNQGAAFSTTSAMYFVDSSTTIPKTYANNTFLGTQTFANLTGYNGTFGVLSATSSATLASTTAYGKFIAANFISTSTATSTFNGPLTVGITRGSSLVSILGNISSTTSATGTAILSVSNDNNTLSTGNNVMRLNIRTPFGTGCTTGTTCPRFIEFFTGTQAGTDNTGTGVGRIQLSAAGTGITQTSGAADFAEYMQLNSSASVGDLVSLNSAGEYQKAIAGQSLIGVISDNPAFVGNGSLEGSTNAYVVGFAGVIETTVSAANGSINAGDFITASSTNAGVGVKLLNSGYALGQALESFSGPDTGTIKVLVLPKYIDASVALESYGGTGGGITGYWDLSTSTGIVTLASSTYSLVLTKATIANASTTAFSSSYASSTRGFFGSLVAQTLSIGSLNGILRATAGAVTPTLVDLTSDVTGILPITRGGTGTSTAPSYGKILVGNSAGGYDYMSTTTLGIDSAVWGNITGSMNDQTDLQSEFATKLDLTDWYSTTTDQLREGTNNKYYADTRVLTYLNSFDKGFFFSTTSADAFAAQRNFFATTSADWWKTQNNFFSTTSADVFLAQRTLFSTTSADYLASQRNFFSTTSADAFLSQRILFSTTSADYWKTANNFFSTTSANWFLSQNQGAAFSTTSADNYAHSSTTIAKTYTNNSFGGLQTFANASTTNISASYASSTQGFFGSLSIGNLNGILKGTNGAVTNGLVDLAADVTGILPVANGGTGWANLAAGAVLYGNDSGKVATTTAGLPGQVLALLGGVPTWTATTTFTGPLLYSNGSASILNSVADGSTKGAAAFTAADFNDNGAGLISLDYANGQKASGSLAGFLASNDWASFNNKVSSTSLSTAYPLLYDPATGGFSLAFGTTTGNSWSQLQTFTNGLLALGSTTIGNGTQAGGLTISGGATTTGFLNVLSPQGYLINGATAVAGSASLNNFFFGGASMSPNLLGTYNYAIGQSAMANATNTNFANNFAAGYLALAGKAAGENTGTYNVAIGSQALTNDTSGSGNIGLGFLALANNAAGSNNVALGYGALENAVSASNNIVLGTLAGRNINSAYSNILLGDNDQIGGGLIFGGGNIAIGPNTFFENIAGSRQLNIGNLLYGTLPATTTGYMLPTSGTIGIGTSTPFGKFSIALNNGDTAKYAFFIASSTPTATTTLFAVSNSGNVGIGTTTPGSALSVQGNQFIAGAITSTSSLASIFPYASTTAISGTNLSFVNASTSNISSSYASSTQGFFGALSIGSLSGILRATAGAVAPTLVDLTADVTGILAIAKGGTGTSTAPSYGKLLIGDAAGNYELVSTSSLGINSGVWGQLSGNIDDQTDLQSEFATKLNLSDWFATTTDVLDEGTTNKYYTDARVGAYISSSSTVPHIGGSAYGDLLSWNGGAWIVRATSTLAINTNDLLEGNNLFFSNARVQTYLNTLDKGYFFSTTSADAFIGQRNFFSTTSADWWKSQNNFFATTSADYFLTQRDLFSTTSVDYWKTANNFFSTTSASWFLSQNQGAAFSTTSADNYAHSSTTIAKTYTNNSFGGTQTFVNASTTNISASYASSTQGFFGSLFVGALSGIVKATTGAIGTALVDLTSDITGILNVGHGGTGWASLAAGAVLYGNDAGKVATTTAGLPGQVLAQLDGVPAWTSTTTFSGGLSYSGGNVTIDFANGQKASGSLAGFLASNDWASFNNKVSSTSLSTAYPLLYDPATGGFSLAFGTTTGNSWSQLQTFTNGLLALGSTTIGDGTRTGGLYISGGATTTGTAYFGSTIGIASSSPWGLLSINANGLSGPILAVGSSSATYFLLDNGGRVGIGTSTPGSVLSVGNVANFTSGTTTFSATGGIALSDGCFEYQGQCLTSQLGTNVVLSAVRTGTATTTWSVPTNLVYAVVELWGGGGGGGSSGSAAPTTGGGGGPSNFGGMATSTGGAGGIGAAGAQSTGGVGGTGVGGDINLTGGGGGATDAQISNFTSGVGGSAPRGGMGATSTIQTAISAGSSGAAYGGGGSGDSCTTTGRCGPGGGGGGYMQKVFTASMLAGTTSVQVGVGSGGVGGAAATNSAKGGNGGAGGYTIYEYTATNVSLGNGTVNSGTTGQFAFYNASGQAVSGTSALYIDAATSNIGVSSTTPWAALSLYVDGETGPAFAVGSSSATYFLIDNGGRVGVGTTSPAAQLAVSGSTYVTGNATTQGIETASNFIATSTIASVFLYASTTAESGINWSYINATSTNFGATNALFTGATSTSFSATSEVITNSTSTSLYSSSLVASNSTSTSLFATTASTSKLYVTGLGGCTVGQYITWANGTFSCATDVTGTFAFPFTPTTAFGIAANATGTLMGFTGGIYATASSTINGGLTIGGGATTTGNTYLGGKLSIGDYNPTSLVSILTNPTTTPFTTTVFSISSSTNQWATTTLFSISSTGTVTGIGSWFQNATSTALGATNALFTNATSTSFSATNALLTNATSTSFSATSATFTNASSTSFAVTGISLGSLIKATTGGALVAAVPGTDFANFAYLFSTINGWGSGVYSTSTVIAFTNGLVAMGSTTVGNGGGNGLYVNGNATTTGETYHAGRLSIGDYNPTSLVSILTNPTTTPFTTTVFSISSSTNQWATTTLFSISSTGTVTGIGSWFQNATSTALGATNALLTNATTTSFSATNALFINATTTSFSATSEIITNATTTSLFATTASTTHFFSQGLGCAAGFYVTWSASNNFGCSQDQAGGGFSFPFTPVPTFGALAANSTSTLIGFTNGLYSLASTTIGGGGAAGLYVNGNSTTTGTTYFTGRMGLGDNAPTSLLSLLASPTTTPVGLTLISVSSSTRDWATTTLLTLTNRGYLGIASTSPWGLTSLNPDGLLGGAPAFVVGSTTSTYFLINNGGHVGIGTSSAQYALDVNGDVNVASGKCFRMNGICIGYVIKLSSIYATSSAGTTTLAFTGSSGSAATYTVGAPGTLALPNNTSYATIEAWGGGGGGASSTIGIAGNQTTLFGISTSTGGGAGAAAAVGAAGGAGGTGSVNAVFGTLGGTASSTFAGTSGGVEGSAISQPGFGGQGGHGGGAGGKKFAAGTSPTVSNGQPFGGGGGASASTNLGGGGGGGGGGYVMLQVTQAMFTSFSNKNIEVGTGAPGVGTNPSGRGGNGGVIVTVYATSSPNAQGNDYAEMFPVSNPGINAADIVSVDAGVPVSMRLAQKGDITLAGVISTAPGQVLGDQNASGMRPVALSGRVPVKFSSENGDVKIGDRIAVSSTPGVGMKAGPFDDSVGIVIGTSNDCANLPATDCPPAGTVMIFIDLERGIDINAIGFSLLGSDAFTLSDASMTNASSTQLGPFDFVGGMMNAIGKRLALFGAPAPEANSMEASSTDTTASSTPQVDGFAKSLLDSIIGAIAHLLADAANGIGDIFANVLHAKEKICVDDQCLSKSDVKALLKMSHVQSASVGSSSGGKAPVIEVQGNNPATIHVGDAYADLGAIISAPAADVNLGITYLVDGLASAAISIDTSFPAEHTITYRVIDAVGNVGEATRTVRVISADQSDASSTPTTDTASSTPETNSTSAGSADSSQASPTSTTTSQVSSGDAASSAPTDSNSSTDSGQAGSPQAPADAASSTPQVANPVNPSGSITP